MKKRIQILLAACLSMMMALSPLAAGAESLRGYTKEDGYQYVLLGTWPQGENGEEMPILWRVLAADDGQALLLSEYVLGNRRVHPDDDEYRKVFKGAWNKTDMYNFLNSTFLSEGFAKEEQSLLLYSEELGTVFLPSGEDLSNKAYGFNSNKSRMAKGTAFALANGLFKYSTKYSPYWTRSQSKTKSFGARCTKVKGNLGYIRVVVENLGWRPACRLNLTKWKPTTGEGTLEAPFVYDDKSN